MSIDYCLLKKVRASDLFDGCLEGFGVREHVEPDETTEKDRCLTDGRNYMWVFVDDDGFVGSITLFAARRNDPEKILNAVAEVFDTYIASEDELSEFDTQEELEAWSGKIARQREDKFHTQLLKYLRGEPNTIRPGTVRMAKAKIAKKLVEKDPTLILPENKDKLHNEIKSVHDAAMRPSSLEKFTNVVWLADYRTKSEHR